MQAVFKQDPGTIDYTPASAVDAGDVVVTNGHVRIAKRDIAANELGALAVEGIFDVVKDNSNISDGNALYWDSNGDPVGGTAGTGAATTTASGNTFMGYAIAAAGVSATTVRMSLVHVPSTLVVNNTVASVIADPGASGAIPVTRSGYVPLVTAAAETRTLAAPTFIGQELLIYMKTDGGDCVVTCATTVNEAGNNTITFDNTGEAFFARAVEEGSNLRWRLAQVDGAALTTV
jgi:predicted RecA/RadA family phage recombinase